MVEDELNFTNLHMMLCQKRANTILRCIERNQEARIRFFSPSKVLATQMQD